MLCGGFIDEEDDVTGFGILEAVLEAVPGLEVAALRILSALLLILAVEVTVLLPPVVGTLPILGLGGGGIIPPPPPRGVLKGSRGLLPMVTVLGLGGRLVLLDCRGARPVMVTWWLLLTRG